MYVRMAHERDRRFLWLKSDGSSPTLTETRAHNPTIHAFRDRVLPKLHENFLPVRTEPIKSLTRPRRGCTRTSNTKTSQTKTNGIKAEIQQTSNYTKHNRKRQGTESRLTTNNKNAARRIPKAKARAKREAIKHNSAVKSRGTRDERAGASPIGGPLTRLVTYTIYRLLYIKSLSRTSREARSPRRLRPKTLKKNPQNTPSPCDPIIYIERASPLPRERAPPNAHIIKIRITSPPNPPTKIIIFVNKKNGHPPNRSEAPPPRGPARRRHISRWV